MSFRDFDLPPPAQAGSAYLNVYPETSQFGARLNKQLAGSLGQVERSIAERIGAGFSRALGGLQRQVASLAGGGTALAGLAATLGTQINTVLERSTTQFAVLQRSVTGATRTIQRLYKFAADTPFEFGDILGAARQLEVVGQNTPAVLTRIGDAAAVATDDAAQGIKTLSYYYGRFIANIQGGRPVGEELERFRELGVILPNTTSRIIELQKANASADEIIKVLNDDLDRFQGGMRILAESVPGLLSTVRDNFEQGLGKALAGVYERFRLLLRGLRDFQSSPAWERLVENAREFADRMAAVTTVVLRNLREIGQSVGLRSLQATFQTLRDTASDLEGPIRGLGLAFASLGLRNIPVIGQLLPTISPLMGVLVGIATQSPRAQAALERLGGTLSRAFSDVAPRLTASLERLAGALTDLLVSALDQVTPLLPRLAELFADVVEPLVNLTASVVQFAAAHPGLTKAIGAFLLFKLAGSAVSSFLGPWGQLVASLVKGVAWGAAVGLIYRFGAALGSNLGPMAAFSKALQGGVIGRLLRVPAAALAAGGGVRGFATALATTLGPIAAVTAALAGGILLWQRWRAEGRKAVQERFGQVVSDQELAIAEARLAEVNAELRKRIGTSTTDIALRVSGRFFGDPAGINKLDSERKALEETIKAKRRDVELQKELNAEIGAGQEPAESLDDVLKRLGIDLEAGAGAAGGMGQALGELSKRAKAARDELAAIGDEIISAFEGFISPALEFDPDAEKAVADARKELEQADRDLIEAEKALAEARKPATDRERTEAAWALTEALREQEDAQHAVAQAAGLADASTIEGIRDLAQNEAALAAAHQHALDLFDQMTTSADERAEAELRLGKANFRVADAQGAINKLNEKGTDVDEDVAAAHERVSEAQERRLEVQERLAEAQRSVMTDGENVIRMLQEQATKATEWGRNMDAAARMGIDQGILRQLARLGPEGNPLLLGFMDAATRFGAGALGAIQRSTEGIVTKVMADVGVLHAFLAREAEKYAEDGAKAGDQYGANFSAKAKEWINNLTVDIPKILAGGAPALAKLNPFLGLLAGIGSKVAEDPQGFLGRAKDFLGFHAGGLVRMHAGGLRPDERVTVLQTGEFVQRRAAVQKYGAGTMAAMNAGTWAGGGVTIGDTIVNVDGSADARTVAQMRTMLYERDQALLRALQARQPRRSR